MFQHSQKQDRSIPVSFEITRELLGQADIGKWGRGSREGAWTRWCGRGTMELIMIGGMILHRFDTSCKI